MIRTSRAQEFQLHLRRRQENCRCGRFRQRQSTVLQLLMRLHDPQHGQVKIDGVDIRSYTLNSLRNQMAIVLQDSYIFNMSIEENIALAKPGARKAEVINASVIAGAH